jgi:hypothetical protein
VTRRRVLDGAVVAGTMLIATGLVIDLVNVASGNASPDVVSDLVLTPIVATFVFLAPAIVRRRPDNPIGAIFSGLVLVAGLIVLVDAYAALVGDPSAGSRPGDEVAAWVANWVWVPFMGVLLCELPLRFPEGALLSRRWRWAERLVLFQITALMVGLAFAPGKLDAYPVENPYTIESIGGLFELLGVVGLFLLVLCVAVSAVAIVLRFRRSRGRERQQLKWLSVGAIGAAVSFAVCAFLTVVFGLDPWGVGVPIAVASVVLSAGLAVLRYRLYDIDRLISRTLSWIALTVTLGLAYGGIVLAGQALFSSFAGGSNLAIAGSTLVVAALFLPLRSRVQRVVDRRFYRRRYDAERTLERFGAHLREEVDLARLTGELRGVVEETIQPSHVSVWLRSGGPA